MSNEKDFYDEISQYIGNDVDIDLTVDQYSDGTAEVDVSVFEADAVVASKVITNIVQPLTDAGYLIEDLYCKDE